MNTKDLIFLISIEIKYLHDYILIETKILILKFHIKCQYQFKYSVFKKFKRNKYYVMTSNAS